MCKRCKAQALEPGSRIHLAPGSATYYKLQIFGGKKNRSLSASVSHLQIVRIGTYLRVAVTQRGCWRHVEPRAWPRDLRLQHKLPPTASPFRVTGKWPSSLSTFVRVDREPEHPRSLSFQEWFYCRMKPACSRE